MMVEDFPDLTEWRLREKSKRIVAYLIGESSEFAGAPIKPFEPTPNFALVLSNRIGKKTIPRNNIKLKENPRPIEPANPPSESRDVMANQGLPEHTQDFTPAPSKALKPSHKFFKVLSGIVGDH